jgi:hypothetical protein
MELVALNTCVNFTHFPTAVTKAKHESGCLDTRKLPTLDVIAVYYREVMSVSAYSGLEQNRIERTL